MRDKSGKMPAGELVYSTGSREMIFLSIVWSEAHTIAKVTIALEPLKL